MELLTAMFEELPERQRVIFDLADLQGYAQSEVAELLEMNPATVRAHLFKARRTIRRRLLEAAPELAEGRQLP
jgi:RNA polymerase sigma-70 factor (ECF subfamily)